jgi:hypothetical protein
MARDVMLVFHSSIALVAGTADDGLVIQAE